MRSAFSGSPLGLKYFKAFYFLFIYSRISQSKAFVKKNRSLEIIAGSRGTEARKEGGAGVGRRQNFIAS